MMHRLRVSFLSLLIHLAILFNLERLDIGGKDVINLDTVVYVLTVTAIIMILSIKWMRMLPRQTLIVLWVGVYIAVKLALISRRPLIGGIYTYLLIAELGLFILAVFLAHTLALNIEDFDQALENFTFANNRKIKRVQDKQEEIQAEIYRSRRFQRPLSVIVLEQDFNKARININKLVQDAQRAMMEQYISVMFARELITKLRQTDLLLETDKKGRLVILSPDTDVAETDALLGRLTSLAQTVGFSINFGTATFPDHALTFEHLLGDAEKKLQKQMATNINTDSLKEVEVGQEKSSAQTL